ncbi:unnamed protein product (macronuclear) [Paramecium tetraurelia]|uniref:Uncharacterized protein n=1 Tax=Paramecium tetraurelia TaxID=5888 RepID=A0EDA3_PARTE|nr:uncharacterized protein GSPATT00004139001 [Paramecium tetraurelia]CAK93270.1 unnamed protein product [Paramecium tetraurelia]|eukprot:XP_001460667.1 hypothetical protein (macronuclear) [Paramecium tetraurelia strain d4-2]
MYNRPSSKPRYQQEPTLDSINLKEKQLYIQSSSINPLTGAVLRPDQQYNQSQQNNANFDKKIALQASSINPLTGAPLVRNPISYQTESIQQKNTPYGVQQNANSYTTSSGQIGSGSNTNDAQFQKNLVKFFAADDPNLVQQKSQQKPNNALPSDPQFQKNLVKFFGADDPSQPQKFNNQRQINSRSNNQYPQQGNQQYQGQQAKIQNDQQFQQNLNKFFAADDPTQVRKTPSKNQYPSPSLSQQKYQPFNEAPPDPRLVNDPSFQKNLNKFYAADDPTQPKKQVSKQSQQQQQINAIEILDSKKIFNNFLEQMEYLSNKRMANSKSFSYYLRNIQDTLQQNNNKSSKVIAITDSSSAARNQVAGFFRARGVEDFDVFTNPGGVFGLQNNPVQEQSLKYYLDTMSNAYIIKEVYIISVLDTNSNVRIYTNLNDKRSHQIAIQDLKTVLENKFNVQQKLHGIIIDQRGASEKAF